MNGLSKIKCLLGVELYEISDKYISELRLAHKNADEVFDILPEYTINTNKEANNQPIVARYFHQFMGYCNDNSKKYLYFNLHTIDNQLHFEINEGGVENLFEDFDFNEILSNFTPLTDNDLEKVVLAPTNYLVVDLTYMTSQDYYGGGWETEMELDIIGYLDNNLEIKMFNETSKELKPSGIGIVVDKSKATETFPLRGTVFQKGSNLNK